MEFKDGRAIVKIPRTGTVLEVVNELRGGRAVYAATTLEGISRAAKTFGKYMQDNKKPIELTSYPEVAVASAIMEAYKKGGNGSSPTPAVLIADAQSNNIPFVSNLPQHMESINLKDSKLLVFDSPDFVEGLKEALGSGKMEKLIALVFEQLKSYISLHKPNVIGGKIDRLQPFVQILSFFTKVRDESY